MGLGTVGFNPPVAERMVKKVGFGHFKTFDFKDPSNLYYEAAEITPQPALSDAFKGKKTGGGVSVAGSVAGSVEASGTSTSAIDLSKTPAPAYCTCHMAGGVRGGTVHATTPHLNSRL